MVRIKIVDLPQDAQISKEEMKKVIGGITGVNPSLCQPSNSLDFNQEFKEIDRWLDYDPYY